jgi:hypothetical protein
MLGDFNEAMWQEEHFSRSKRSEGLMMNFCEVLSHCDLHDLGFVGTPWTFDNKQKGERNVKVRLDRAVASPEWSALFPNMRVRHLISSRSDHCPLLISADMGLDRTPTNPIRRYEVMWEREPSLNAAVEESWSRIIKTQDLGDINTSLKAVMCSLYSWKSKNIGNVPKELERKRKQLEALSIRTDDESLAKKRLLEKDMDELLYREEIMWLQRSRISWLREGDRNTKYFHRRASSRRKKNRISRLKRPDGSWTSDTNEMETITRDFFQGLYAQDGNIDHTILTDLLHQCVDDDTNEMLCAHFSVKEISDALF